MIPSRAAVIFLVLITLLASCQSTRLAQEPPSVLDPAQIPAGLSAEERATLASLEQVDEHPLYTMRYQTDYQPDDTSAGIPLEFEGQADWACSLFAVSGDPEEMLYGRNFDWDFSPGLLLFTDPEDGYASVSMVDLHYLGFGSEQAYGLEELPLEDLSRLLDAPFLPFDGMNEAGLAIGMAAVPDGGVPPDPEKETIDSLHVIRMILDGAASIEEALKIFQTFNIDWGSGPALHYLVADASGRSALVEFSKGELVVHHNQDPWQAATNFLVSEASTAPATHCWRYGLITEQIETSNGSLTAAKAMSLLEAVSQTNTQWSVVYRISAGEVQIVMGREYSNLHRFPFPLDN